MEDFIKNITEFLEPKGFKMIQEEDITRFVLDKSVQQHGSTLIINGQQIQQPGNIVRINIEFALYSPCDIEDVNTGKIDRTIMCRYYLCVENTEPQVDLFMNYYPTDIELVKLHCAEILKIK